MAQLKDGTRVYGTFYANTAVIAGAANVEPSLIAGNNYTNSVGLSANSFSGHMANSVNAYAVSLDAASNSWANTVGTAGNNYTNFVGTSSNNYTNDLTTSGNNYTNEVGTAGNNYTNVVGVTSNTWANTVGVAGNNYTDTVGAAGNNYSVAVGLASNTWSNTIASAGNNYTNEVGTAGNNYTSAVGTSGNNYANYIGTSGNNYTNDLTTAGNNYTNEVGAAGNNHTNYVGASSNNYSNGTFIKITSPSQTITGDLSVTGNLFLLGNATTITSNNLVVNDSLIYLAANNDQSDIVDIGFIGHYSNGTANLHTGLFRDHNSKNYYLFQNLDGPEPSSTNDIIPYANGMIDAVLHADIISANVVLSGLNVESWISSAYDTANGSNGWANTVGAAGNNYASFVGTSSNNYSNDVGTAGNNYTNEVGTAGNNYTNYVGVSANAYAASLTPDLSPAFNTANAAFGVANNALANTSGVSFNGDLNIPAGNLAIGIAGANATLHVNGTVSITGAPSNSTYQTLGSNTYSFAFTQAQINADPFVSLGSTPNTLHGLVVSPRFESNTAAGFGILNNIRAIVAKPIVYTGSNQGRFNVVGVYSDVMRTQPEELNNTSTSKFLYGQYIAVGHGVNVNSAISTSDIFGSNIDIRVPRGNVSFVAALQSSTQLGSSVSGVQNNSVSVSTVYGIYISATLSTNVSSTYTTTVGTYYDAYLGGMSNNTNTTVTNKYGVYQVRSNHINYFAGNVGIGRTTADYQLDVAGSINAASVLVNGSPITVDLSPAFNQANAAFGVANNALANTDNTVFSGNLIISATVQSAGLKDSSGRTLLIKDSAGTVVWGN